MLFFFRKPTIELIAYIEDKHAIAFNHAPIRPAREFFPIWWKSTSSSHFNWDKMQQATTVKGCPGIINSLTSGFNLPFWCDLAIKYDKDNYHYIFSDGRSSISEHIGAVQAPNFYKNYHIIKLDSPWLIKSPVSLQYSYPFYYYADPLPYITPPGVITPINGLCSTNIFMFLEKTPHVNEVMIKQGTPAFNILPLTEKTVTIRTEMVTSSEFTRLDGIYGNGTHFLLKGLRHMRLNNLKK